MTSSLTKLHVDLPNHLLTGGESLWARDLGEDLYEIDNVPFHIYGLNLGDVVRAIAPSPDLKPEILEVIRESGHRTLRVYFPRATSKPDRFQLLKSLAHFGVTYENKDGSLFALDIVPDGDLTGVLAHLDALVASGVLEYETCEARQPGSFDDLPEEPPAPDGAAS